MPPGDNFLINHERTPPPRPQHKYYRLQPTLLPVLRSFSLVLVYTPAPPPPQVTSSHGHHGQLPAAEYLVATAAHGQDPATSAPAFMGWLPFLELCAEVRGGLHS